MKAFILGLSGDLAGHRFLVGKGPVTFGRGDDNDIVLRDPAVSRFHAELRSQADGLVLADLGSANGTQVNGASVTEHPLRPGDEIAIATHQFAFELLDGTEATGPAIGAIPSKVTGTGGGTDVLRVTISGGGPVGLAFALLLTDLLGPKVAIRIFNGRWKQEDGRVVWRGIEDGNVRRQQVVTIQSRQFLKLPPEMQGHLFTAGSFTEMWPSGPDSVEGVRPRNMRIADIEDRLLDLARRKGQIDLVPEQFDVASGRTEIAGQHVLAICEGSHPHTLSHFERKFGTADPTIYGLDGEQLSDIVLGLRVKSTLPDPMAVVLTVAQNRFLLNSLNGEGFLNMRLTAREAQERTGRNFSGCIQMEPCLHELGPDDDFVCGTHHTLFLPSLRRGSAFWSRVQDGLALFGVPPENLTAVTCFQLNMEQRSRFSAQLFPRTTTTPGTYGFLLGDSANDIHFWPGRGLNSGLASAISLARCLARSRRRGPLLRDADFVRHEAVMSMLQYRHKNRAWLQMVTADDKGAFRAIRDIIDEGVLESEAGNFDRDSDLEALLTRMIRIRNRLAPRIEGMPDDATLRKHLESLSGPLLHTLLVSGAWDTANVGGEEVDIDWLLAREPMSSEGARS